MSAKATRRDGAAGRSRAPDDELLFERLVHDLRNPLGVIAYYAETLGDESELSRAELCDRLQVNAQRALQVLEEFALIADLRSARLDDGGGDWDVLAVAREVARQVERMERSAHPLICAGEAGVRARGDVARWACALRALLREVVRAARGEQSIALACSRAGDLVALRLTVPVAVGPEFGVLPYELPALQCELIERLAALSGGRVGVESTGEAVSLVLTLPGAARTRAS